MTEKTKKILFELAFMIVVFGVGVVVGKNLQEILQIKAAEQAIVDAENERIQQELEQQQSEEEAIAKLEEQIKEKEEQNTIASEKDAEENPSENNTVSGNESVSDNQISGGYKPDWNEDYVDESEHKTLEQRLALRNSYEETLDVNLKDKEVIANSQIDFSNMTIACLGDSITEGVEGEIPYPTYLKEILGAKEVYNYGVGGSTVARDDGAAPMVDRIEELPEDVDLIIVLGGTNDNFYQAYWQYGYLYWESKGAGTFCGDMQLLMRRVGWNFPNAGSIFFTPPSNSKIDELKQENVALMEQKEYATAIKQIGAEEGYDVVDLYNQNFLNSHDPNVVDNLMHDNVHPNSAGNKMLAERVASEIIKRYQP